jgi:hypothetical protein
MTTITSTLSTTRPAAQNRILAVTRLQFVNRWTMFYLPAIILGAILLLNMAIWYIVLASLPTGTDVAHAEKGFQYTGAVFYIFIYMLVVAVQAISRTFPFALGFGVTRRNYYLGTALAFTLLAIGFSVLLTVLSVIELATNGWGAGGHMFTPTYLTNASWGLRFVMYLCLFLFFLFVGSAIAAVYVRWRAFGITVFFAIIALLIVGSIAIITLGHHWPSVGNWLATTGAVGLTAWLLLPAAIAAVAGFFVLRRATPKS